MMDKNREAFEAWFEKEGHADLCRGSNMGAMIKHIAKSAWYESRQAIEVEMNVSGERYAWSDGVFNLKEDLKKQFASLGIRVKGNEE
ncbi:hypothetical protein [Ewingella americana]|uniref:hypothetical protein n=1 Tax=Ewingella americana TaxID=41202 RepID=UPI0012AE825B|nr:hypothetical protein [Ewingella americana]MRT01907.1 hypothetical protein [Ewingella americana]